MSDATRQLYAQHLSLEQARTGDPRLPRQAGDHSTFLVSFLRIIGKGTYGKVYLVRNVTTNEAMALKRVDIPSSATHESNPRRASIPNSFSREVEMLTKLDHLSVVPYLGVDKMPTSLNIFFEYIPGGSIAGRLRKHGKLNEEVIKLFASQILDGLEYLHSKDIIHGRLDSNHILLNKSDICKISLCISSITDRDSTVNVPFLGHGSALCMAPEMLTYSVTSLSSKVDIWGIGYVVYEMWSGRKQWNEQGGQTIEFHAKQGSLVPADVHLSPLAEEFLQKCFAIDPNERSTATELRKHPYLVPERTWMLNGLR
ncbi:kinase-like protein [Wolfiporia cocos MD-104 SS10]|uniref:Kinase-like protein n=1 Tax=Wolfiporia cocos (strain MD-104) TaxID=742152 RepID=A0A2H3JK21_WOLCO|nr:kinase-like protein [Wolfiporia cocos MD-104 SS10]